MRLQIDPRLPIPIKGNESLHQRLYDLFRSIASSFNDSFMWDGMGTTYPTTGAWAQGDKVKNSAPTELGSVSSKYIVIGWCCVTSGTSGTWKEMRVLTGG